MKKLSTLASVFRMGVISALGIILSITVFMAVTPVPAIAAINPQPSQRKVERGSLESFVIYSPEMERDVEVEVLLPEGYDAKERYPVVYMHDGQNLVDPESNWNKQSWGMDLAVDRLEGQKPIVVGVFSLAESRIGDLMPTEVVEMINPQVRETLFAQFPNFKIQGDRYVDFLANTLKPEIDSHYSTLSDSGHTSVMGSSMGGLSSAYAICRHPETFGAAGCLSTHLIGSFGPNEIFPTAFAAYLLRRLPVDGSHRIYFDTGDQTIDANYIPYFSRLMQMISEMGMDEDHFLHKTFPGASHEEKSWAERVDIPLQFVLWR